MLEEKFDLHKSQITRWKMQRLENASGVFPTAIQKQATTHEDLNATIGQQGLEIDFLPGVLGHIVDASAKQSLDLALLRSHSS